MKMFLTMDLGVYRGTIQVWRFASCFRACAGRIQTETVPEAAAAAVGGTFRRGGGWDSSAAQDGDCRKTKRSNRKHQVRLQVWCTFSDVLQPSKRAPNPSQPPTPFHRSSLHQGFSRGRWSQRFLAKDGPPCWRAWGWRPAAGCKIGNASVGNHWEPLKPTNCYRMGPANYKVVPHLNILIRCYKYHTIVAIIEFHPPMARWSPTHILQWD